MKLETVRTLTDTDSPFVTVYLGGHTPSGDADGLRLRWRNLRDRLSGDGAPDPVLRVLDAALPDNAPGDPLRSRADGRVLVADGHGVILDEPWEAAPGTGDHATVGQVPVLGPYVRQRLDAVRVLLAVVDRTGATLRRIVAVEDTSSIEDDGDTETVMDAADAAAGDAADLRPRQGALSHNRIRQHGEESVAQDARGAADQLDAIATGWTPDVLVLAGEAQNRHAVRTGLADPFSSLVRETDAGEESLREELSGITSDIATARRIAGLQRFEEARVRGRTVEGTRAVAQAADTGDVDTLLLRYRAPARDDSGPDEDDLLTACARAGAEVALVDTPLKENVAAVLRSGPSGELRDRMPGSDGFLSSRSRVGG